MQSKARQGNVDVASVAATVAAATAADANVAAELRATVTTAAAATASTWLGQWAQDVVVSRSMP